MGSMGSDVAGTRFTTQTSQRHGSAFLSWYGRIGVVVASMLVLVGGALPAARVHAVPLTVATCDKADLDAALSSANSGDTITFGCSGTITDIITINTSLTLDATGQQVTLNGNQPGYGGHRLGRRQRHSDRPDHHRGPDGCHRRRRRILNQGTLTVQNSTLSGNVATFSGRRYCQLRHDDGEQQHPQRQHGHRLQLRQRQRWRHC